MVDIAKLESLGHIRTQRHPELPLIVCKYTRQFQQRGLWDKQMLGMRGAVYDTDGELISQPLRKFFNYGEKPKPDGTYTVQKKLDGTCIVAFRWNGIPVVHTLGSFTSPQAEAARQYIEDVYGWDWLGEGITYVFEWLDPDNFTTLQHRGDRQLVLLAWLINGWEILMPCESWPGPVVQTVDPDDIDQLQANVPDDEEGYVLVFDSFQLGQRNRMKIKGERYLAMHRAKWNLTERVVWEYTFERPDEQAAFVAQLDEEARMWFDAVQNRMREHVTLMRSRADVAYQHAVNGGSTLREQIEVAKQLDPPYRHIVLYRLNGKQVDDSVFAREVKPKGSTPYAPVADEDAA